MCKRVCKLVLGIIAILLLYSCYKPDSSTQPSITIPDTENLSPVIGNAGGNASLKFMATDAWTASVMNTEANDWCSVYPISGGAGESQITIHIVENSTYEDRSVTIQVKCGSASKTIQVTQKQKNNITLINNTFEVEAGGGDIKVLLETNIQFVYHISEECTSWISFVSTKTNSAKILTFNVSKNESNEIRRGIITIAGGGLSRKVTVYQAGEEASIVLSQNQFEIAPEGGLVDVDVLCNVDLEVIIPSSAKWITVHKTKSMSTSTYQFSIAANDSYISRSAMVDFINKSNNLRKSITINQLAIQSVPVTSVSLDKDSVELKVGETVTLTATVNPSDATDKTVTWSTSDATVATVNNGVVTAVKVGTTTITAKAGDKTATCVVTVVATPVTSVTLNKNTATLKAGETVTLTATVNPSDATDKTVTWSTSDATVATVNNGVVTAVKVGTATITAKAGDKTATCVVTVVATPVTSVILDKTSASLKAGETVTLTATVNPSDVTDKTVTWSTSDASVATVSNGVVTAVKVGTATITAKSGDKTATCTITVVPTPVTSVTLDKTSASLKAGETVTLTATVNPSDATDKTVTWSTSDATVATVNNGVVTAVKVGTAIITAKAGDKSMDCIITVTSKQGNEGFNEENGDW